MDSTGRQSKKLNSTLLLSLCLSILWGMLIWMGVSGYKRGVLFSAGTEWYWAHVIVAVIFTLLLGWIMFMERPRRP